MFYFDLISQYINASVQKELAYRENFWISVLHSSMNLATGILGIFVVFGQVESIHGWDQSSVLVLLGVYLIVGAMRRLFIGPSLESLAGIDGEVWSGKFDFTLLKPVDIQFQATFRYWKPLSLIDFLFGFFVLCTGVFQSNQVVTILELLNFTYFLGIGILILYALLLLFSGLVFWSPGFLFTWIFDALYQMARYPIGLYPGWVRLILTWIIPVGIMTTFPSQAMMGSMTTTMKIFGTIIAIGFFVGASILFRIAVKRYISASS